MKKIKTHTKLCEKQFNHTITSTDWKSAVKLKHNTVDEQYDMDEKSVHEASNYNALIVGSENYNQQYPTIAYQNLMNIYGTIHRRMQTKHWDVPLSIRNALDINLCTPIHFKDQLPGTSSKKKGKKHTQSDTLPSILQLSDIPPSIASLKDGTDKKNMPYLIDTDGNIEVLIYRNIANNIKSKRRIHKVMHHFEPDSIILDCNTHNLQQYYEQNAVRNTIRSMFGCVTPAIGNMHMRYSGDHAISAVIESLVSTRKFESNVIMGNMCDDYYRLLCDYAFLCDLYSLSAIEISPILPNKLIPKKIKTLSTKLLKPDARLTSEMRYLIGPYFLPHSHLFGQITNSFLMHCLYGTMHELKSRKILMVVNDDNAFDLMTKMLSNPVTGFYFKYAYNTLFKEVNDEFVTTPTALPTTYMRNAGVKLKEFEWKTLHSMFGIKFVEFLEHEIEMKQALVTK